MIYGRKGIFKITSPKFGVSWEEFDTAEEARTVIELTERSGNHWELYTLSNMNRDFIRSVYCPDIKE